MVEAVKRNFPQREIADASWRYQTEVDEDRRLVVGVNRYEQADEEPIEILQDRPGARAQADGPARRRHARGATAAAVESARSRSSRRPRPPGRNLMYPLIECARARCSEGEMIEALQQVFGSYRESPVF